MFTVQYKDINDRTFFEALTALSGQTMSTLTSYRVAKIRKRILEEIQTGREVYRTILKNFSNCDEKGEPILNKENVHGWDIPAEKIEAFEAEQKNFFEITIEMPYAKLTLPEISGTKLTADQIGALDCILDQTEGINEEGKIEKKGKKIIEPDSRIIGSVGH